jgi:hypothetical protein
MFVFWYCHKRGRETRLEKEGLAAKEAESGLASSASSFADDDSLLSTRGEASGSKSKEEKAEPPLIIGDSAEASQKPSTAVEDMPSVVHLPDPKTVPLPKTEGNTPALEDK